MTPSQRDEALDQILDMISRENLADIEVKLGRDDPPDDWLPSGEGTYLFSIFYGVENEHHLVTLDTPDIKTPHEHYTSVRAAIYGLFDSLTPSCTIHSVT